MSTSCPFICAIFKKTRIKFFFVQFTFKMWIAYKLFSTTLGKIPKTSNASVQMTSTAAYPKT